MNTYIHTDLHTANRERNKAWDTASDLTPSFRVNELLGEIGELCNVIKKLERERLNIRGSRDTLQHLAEELGDGVICLTLVASEFDLKLTTTWQNAVKPLPTDHAVSLGIALGNLCSGVRDNAPHLVWIHAMEAMGALRALAAHYGLDLDRCAAEKFNATSRKVGLNHFMHVDDDWDGLDCACGGGWKIGHASGCPEAA